MNILNANRIVSDDMSVNRHLSAYPPFLRSHISDNWSEIRTEHDMFNNNLASNFLRIRIGFISKVDQSN